MRLPGRSGRLAVAALGIAAFGLQTAAASPILWTLSDVTFAGGGTASGSLVFDADTNTFSNIDIVTSGGSMAGATYTTISQAPIDWEADEFVLVLFPMSVPAAGTTGLVLEFFNPFLTDAGGIIPLEGNGAYSVEGTCSSTPCASIGDERDMTSGEVVAGPVPDDSVPEPSSLVLCSLGGLILLGKKLRRRRSARL